MDFELKLVMHTYRNEYPEMFPRKLGKLELPRSRGSSAKFRRRQPAHVPRRTRPKIEKIATPRFLFLQLRNFKGIRISPSKRPLITTQSQAKQKSFYHESATSPRSGVSSHGTTIVSQHVPLEQEEERTAADVVVGDSRSKLRRQQEG